MKTLSLIFVGLMACLAIGVSTARGQVFYSLEDMGVVKGMDYAQVTAINSQGHATGTAYKGIETCVFHYDYLKKFMEDAGGYNSRGFGISSTNLVVGDNVFFTGPMAISHAAIFKGGVPVDLGVLKGELFSRANGINATGQVVGFSGRERDSDNSRAFVWTNQTGMFDIGTLGGSYAQAYAINDAGFVTGASETWAAIRTTHAFIYQVPHPPYLRSARMTDLGVLGGFSSYGTAINSLNHVAGYSTLKMNSDRVHAFLHNGKGMIDLGSLGARGTESDVSVALGMNNLDQVVGYSYLPVAGEMPLQQVAFLWRRGQMINLNKLLLWDVRKTYLLVSANGINDYGQIVANAYDIQNGTTHAVLLTPNGPTH